MKIAFLSNYFNHHQKPFCDAMYKKIGDGFRFIATSEVSEWRKKLGYQEMTAEYVVKYDKQLDNYITDCDVVIIGSAPYELIKERLTKGNLTFVYSERLYKTGIPWLKLPLYAWRHYKKYGRYKNLYLLCASAYTAYDFSLTRCFIGKSFKWGYFPETISYHAVDAIINQKGNFEGQGEADTISILWVGRIIDWKHPESMIALAQKLDNDQVNYHINIIGTGDMDEYICLQIHDNNLQDRVSQLGSIPATEVRDYMKKADIYVFTSDYNEGWGAVLNEAMNSACALVASHAIGSVPFLLKDGQNGLVFQSCDWDEMYQKVKVLIDDPNKRKQMSKAAYDTIINQWNANNASDNLMSLIEALINKKPTPVEDGPCSVAEIIK